MQLNPLKQVKTIDSTDIEVIVENSGTYNSSGTATKTVTIPKGEKIIIQNEIKRGDAEFYLIDGEKYGYPGILLEIPKEAVTPVYPWQVLGIIIILAVMLVWYVKLSIANKTI